MVDYTVTTVVTAVGPASAVAALLETAIEAVANSKTIRLYSIYPSGGGGTRFVGVLVHDT